MKAVVVTIGMLCALCGGAFAQGVGFGSGGEPRYPANPQYQYSYPYDGARATPRRKCPHGQVLHRGRCKPAQPLALPF